MTVRAAEVFPAATAEDEDFARTLLVHDFCGNGSAGNRWGAKRNFVAFANHHHLIEGDGVTNLSFKLFDGENGIGLNAVLLTAGLNDCVHLCAVLLLQLTLLLCDLKKPRGALAC